MGISPIEVILLRSIPDGLWIRPAKFEENRKTKVVGRLFRQRLTDPMVMHHELSLGFQAWVAGTSISPANGNSRNSRRTVPGGYIGEATGAS